MKKILIISVVLLACIFCVSARNGQEIIPLSSGLYDAMDALFIMEGKALPSTVRPWRKGMRKSILDGHIAFNEPFTSLSSRTGLRTLTTDNSLQ